MIKLCGSLSINFIILIELVIIDFLLPQEIVDVRKPEISISSFLLNK